MLVKSGSSAGAEPVLSYRPPMEEDAALLLGWRTRPDITRHMLTDIDTDLDGQRAWLRISAEKPGFVHRLICLDGVPVGYASVTTVDPIAGVGTVGVYVAEVKARAGIAGFNFIHTLNHAFFPMGLNKIVNHIMGGNARLIRAQRFNGYRHVGVLHRQVQKYGELHDLHIFEQFREDWVALRPRFRDERDFDGVVWPSGR
jgi:RimJ/RimL family protein N-acetyltransferase